MTSNPWSLDYNISFDSQGGSEVTGKTAAYNSLIAAPAAPVKEGYTFVGWYKETECTNAWDFTNDRVTSDTPLYAKWTDEYDINKDGKIDTFDLAIIARNYNTKNGEVNWNPNLDLINDGIVDIYDLVCFSKKIN